MDILLPLLWLFAFGYCEALIVERDVLRVGGCLTDELCM